jgi:hypothetical protein
MTADDGDRALREAFAFDTSDLAANRAGRFSPRQQVRLRAGQVGMRLSLAVFAVVMLGSVGFVVFMNRRLETPGGAWSGVGVAAAVAAAVILIGFAVSRGHLRAAGSRQIAAAQGPAEVVADSDEDCRIRIGPTVLRLPGPGQLEAFRAGTEYRVYYLAGPVPIVLSAERLWERRETQDDPEVVEDAQQAAERAMGAGAELSVFRRGYAIVVLLGLLALGIPLAGVMLSDLPALLRPVAWVGLFAVAIGFVWWSRAWLERGGRRR